MRRFIVLAALLLSGCANFNEDIQKADASCAGAKTMAPRSYCYEVAERKVWESESPETLADFDAFSARRLQLSEDLDANRITSQQFSDSFAVAARALATAQQEAAQARSERDAAFARAMLQGLAAAAAARANVQPVQQTTAPSAIQHTSCERDVVNPSIINCTTTNY